MADEDVKPQGLQGLHVALEAAAEAERVTVPTLLGIGHYRPHVSGSIADMAQAINRATNMTIRQDPTGRRTLVIRMTTAEVMGEQEPDK